MKLNVKSSQNSSKDFSGQKMVEEIVAAPAVTWEELRKEARTLENQVDVKLIAFGKFGTTLGQTKRARPPSSASADLEPLLPNGGSEDDEDTSDKSRLSDLSSELEGLLNRLAVVNDSLAQLAGGQTGQSAAVHHTLQRHRDILLDYKQEFTRTRANLVSTLERRDLLTSVRRDINDYRDGGPGGRSRMDILLKESEHIRNSERMIDDQINIAIESRETLINQRQAFKAIQAKLNDLSSRFPLVNNLVQKINLRKRRDTIIIGAVIGVCVTFMLWYVFA